MDARITKDRIDKHLEYDWFKYILIVIAAILLWMGVYSVADNPKPFERMDIFVAANSFTQENETEFRDLVAETLHNDTAIRRTNIIYLTNDMQLMTTAFTCDVFITTADMLHRFAALPLNDEVLGLIGVSALDVELGYAEINGEPQTEPTAIRLNSDKLRGWLPEVVTQTDEEGNEIEVEQVYYVGIVTDNFMGGGENIGTFNRERHENKQTFSVVRAMLRD